MPRERVAQRTFDLPAYDLFYRCITALGHMRAQVEAQDNQSGTITARLGGGLFGPSGALELALTALDDGRTRLDARYRPRAWGGDQRILPAFLQLLESLAARR